MSYRIIPLFHTPLYIDKIDISDTEKHNLINQDYEDIEARNGRMSKTKFLLNEAKFRRLRDKLNKHIDVYTRDVLAVGHEITFVLQNSWCMKHHPGHFSQIHYHRNSILSGVIYIKTLPTSGDLYFHNTSAQNNLLSPIFSIPFEKVNIHNANRYVVRPEDGTIVIFPSCLSHRAQMNKSKSARYCLPFNYIIKGVLGPGTETTWSLGKEYEL